MPDGSRLSLHGRIFLFNGKNRLDNWFRLEGALLFLVFLALFALFDSSGPLILGFRLGGNNSLSSGCGFVAENKLFDRVSLGSLGSSFVRTKLRLDSS